MFRALLVSILIMLVGCSPSSSEDSVRLFVMDCGELEFADISLFSLGNDETPVRKMFVPCYLIDRPDGTLLWDAGLDPAHVGKGRFEENGIYQIYEKSVMDQVREIEVSLEAENAWLELLKQAPPMMIGTTECTPGYYNNEGKGWGQSLMGGGYPFGPVAYFKYLNEWGDSGEFKGLEFRS